MNEVILDHIPSWAYMIAVALLSASCSHWLTILRENRASKKFKASLLKSLRVEIELFDQFVEESIGTGLTKTSNGVMWQRFEFTQDYFTVYSANCSQIGKLEAEVSRKVVRAYTMMKGLLEIVNSYNRLLNKEEDDFFRNAEKIQKLQHATKNLQANYLNLLQEFKELYDAMDKLGAKL
jgi:hypothetical protein